MHHSRLPLPLYFYFYVYVYVIVPVDSSLMGNGDIRNIAMSRREELKQKQALQARFQHAIGQNNQRALSWLSTGAGDTTSPESELLALANSDFFNMPILSQGATLSELLVVKLNRTVGEYIKGASTASTGAVAKPRRLKAMQALHNKMRTKGREMAKNDRKKLPQNKHSHVARAVSHQDDSDSDDDAHAKTKMAAKKAPPSKRPF